ncbi:MAG: NTP transferase domain-containing protein [Nanoarchaeota archaeon]|nr:NTP transferase domain-containing protein [Nanoarchaeota archaeon]
MDVVILAAGRGIRLNEITKDLPKPLVEINGKPLLDYLIKQFSDQNLNNIYFIVGYKKEKIISYVESIKNKYNINPKYIVQKELKGPAHTLSLLPETISNEFILTVGDSVIYDLPYTEIINSKYPIMLVEKTNKIYRKGIIDVKGKFVVSCYYNSEKKEGYGLTDLTFLKLPKDIIEYAKNYNFSRKDTYIPELISDMIKENKIKIGFLEYNGEIIHITSIDDLRKT